MSETAATPSRADLSQFRVRGEIPVPSLIVGLTLAAIPLLSFFAFRAHLKSDAQTLYVLAFFAGALCLNAVWYLLCRNDTILRRGFIVLITVLFFYLAVAATENGAAIMWLYAYPPIIFYISDARVGVIACAGGYAALATLFSPLGALIAETPYSVSFKIVMLCALAFEMVSCYVLDQSRRRSKLGLLKLAADFEYAAKHDALTGLANRREGHAQLNIEHERYRRHGRPFSVVLIDIDLFKNINDTYGHLAGDRMITMVARTLQAQCRKVDTVARWGGEEFLVVLPETDGCEACRTGNRIRQAIADQVVEFEGQALAATISAGVATILGAESIDRLLQRADDALYKAKTSGRNTVCDGEALDSPGQPVSESA
ncbi:MAG: GGDEF domain-containing protein [Marinobacter sp.]|uniref:GGDEF domain-containing protein n=1 Tax=Marinobacter sp. TaxID=50741 RepID=UPI00299E9DAD|nr:GGDEF domain-containing protein [Marinobacter sp.]MDX1634768.1 GGDEF domain-containing protein [Marinobacter sp.]